MILNLGVGLGGSGETDENRNQVENGAVNGDGDMEVDDEGHAMNGENGEEGENGEAEEANDWGALALFESVVEEREDRLSDEDVATILGIIRETLTEPYGNGVSH